MEVKKKEKLAPYEEQKQDIRDTYDFLMAPILDADRITRDRMTVFMVEEQRKQVEADELNRQAIELARKQAEMNQGEHTVDLTPVVGSVVPRLTRTESATSGLVANWKYRIVDIEKLPRAYMMPNDAMLSSVAKKNHDKSPVEGVEFYNDPHVSTRGKY